MLVERGGRQIVMTAVRFICFRRSRRVCAQTATNTVPSTLCRILHLSLILSSTLIVGFRQRLG